MNRNTNELHPRTRQPLRGVNWWCLDKLELKAFITVNLLMGIKCLPNYRSDWNRANEFLNCPSIMTIMTNCRYEDITRCLHVVDDSFSTSATKESEFNKLHKMH